MSKRWFPAIGLCVVSLLVLHEVRAQEIKSGPQVDEQLPGSFQPLNINGEFKDRHHCLVCQYRVNPVVLVFVRQSSDKADPEVKKLLETVDKLCKENYGDYGLSAFAVFLTRAAKSSVTVGKGPKDADVKDTAVIEEAQLREKLIVTLRKESVGSEKVIWTIFPAEAIADRYKLSEKAEVTVLLYYRHNVMANFVFGEGKLNEAGVEKVHQGVDAMLERISKGTGAAKKGDAGK